MAIGRSAAVYGRRRSSKKSPPTPTPRPPSQELAPLPPGTEVEVRVDDEGFYGSWYEATVVGFEPAGGRGSPARYTVTFSHLVSEDGPDPAAVSHVRPRPPPPPPPSSGPGSSSSPPAPAPGFLLHDIVEVFDCGGWWSGIVVDPVPDPADHAAPVTVAFPMTREVVTFPPHLIRRRRDYVDGEWVSSLAVIAIQPKRGAKVYKAGEMVEVLRERKAGGDSWFPATVAKAVDKLSYIVEYLDEDQEGGGMAKEYLHWGYIRPAQYHRPRESKVRLGPGAAVEVYCDGGWSPGVVCRVDMEGCDCEYAVSVDGEESERVLSKAKAVLQLRPLYMWNGRHWTIPSDMRQANSRQQSASRKRPSSSDDEHSCGHTSSTAKESGREPQLKEFILDESSEHASVSQKNGLSMFPQKILSVCSSSKNRLLYAPSGDPAPPGASNESLNPCPALSEKNSLSVLPHKIVSACSVSKNQLLYASSGHSAPPEELIPNAIGETEFSRGVLSEMAISDGQLNTLVCGGSADQACDMVSIPEVREHNIASSLRNQQTQERPVSLKVLSVKKGISKNNRGGTHRKAHGGKNDASCHMQVQLKENSNFSSKELVCAPLVSAECQTTSAPTKQVSGGIIAGSDTECFNFERVARNECADLLDKDLAATVNMICQASRNAVVCTDTAATQNDESNSDNIQLRSCTFSANSMPSHLPFSQISGDKLPFLKNSPAWSIIDVMDVFKKFPQQPHFRPLRDFLPALREGMALGLMVTFASSVEAISKSCIADSIGSLKEKISLLHHLEENGFNVQVLRCSLDKLLQIKSDHIRYLTEKEQLGAQALAKTASLSQVDEQLDQKEQAIARLEEELGRARQEAQRIAEEKEREDKELSILKVAGSSVDEACKDAELQFRSVLAELHRKSLTH